MLWKLCVIILCTVTCGESVNCPKYCTCFTGYNILRTAKCVGQQLIDIEFDIPEAVQVLDLSNNSISYLENKCFQKSGLLQLLEIDLKYNTLIYIDPDAFDGLTALRRLDLRGNHLHKISTSTFNDNLNLVQLVLSGNPLKHLTNTPFLEVPNLEILDISRCRFGHISANFLNGFPKLKTLNLSGNQLITINSEVFESLPDLEEINISQTKIECEDGSFKLLMEWMDNRTIHLSGSPCKDEVENFQPNKKQMFEKMEMHSGEFTLQNDEKSIANYWVYDDNFLQSKMKTCGQEKKNITMVVNQISDNCDHLIVPQFWVLIIGFEVGIIFTLIGTFIWCMCERNYFNKQERESLLKSQAESVYNLQEKTNVHNFSSNHKTLPELLPEYT